MLRRGGAIWASTLQGVLISRRRRRRRLVATGQLGLKPGESPRVLSVLRQRLDLPDLPLEEADATGELFALMRCGPPFAFEHSAANHPQQIELRLQLAVCLGRQRLVDSV